MNRYFFKEIIIFGVLKFNKPVHPKYDGVQVYMQLPVNKIGIVTLLEKKRVSSLSARGGKAFVVIEGYKGGKTKTARGRFP